MLRAVALSVSTTMFGLVNVMQGDCISGVLIVCVRGQGICSGVV